MLFSAISFFARISYELMWLFSYIEIMIITTYNQTFLPIKESDFFKSIKETIVGEDELIRYVKDGDVIHKTTRNGSLDFNEDYDFLVDTTLSHQVIHTSRPDNLDDYIVSNAEFILTELYIGTDKLQIKFVDKSEGYSYAVVNNVIDVKFLMYFIKKHYNDQFCFIVNQN